jgi:hypothetical protein
MIISASRRTDIPAFYADWFVNRLNAGYCLVKNPFNPKQIRRVSLLPEDVDGIVFWTKNAAPIISVLPVLDKFRYYFQYSITPYHADIERGLASKRDTVIPAFLEIAKNIGAGRVLWRYDPILITDKYNYSYHISAFSRLCRLLGGSTEKCVVSFAIAYKSVVKNLRDAGYKDLNTEEKITLIESILPIAKDHGITLYACCELPELYQLGIQPISCVDADMFCVNTPRDKNQRKGCNCAESVDVGAYNSCMNGCLYCYANHAKTKVEQNYLRHDSNGELLIGPVRELDKP